MKFYILYIYEKNNYFYKLNILIKFKIRPNTNTLLIKIKSQMIYTINNNRTFLQIYIESFVCLRGHE